MPTPDVLNASFIQARAHSRSVARSTPLNAWERGGTRPCILRCSKPRKPFLRNVSVTKSLILRIPTRISRKPQVRALLQSSGKITRSSMLEQRTPSFGIDLWDVRRKARPPQRDRGREFGKVTHLEGRALVVGDLISTKPHVAGNGGQRPIQAVHGLNFTRRSRETSGLPNRSSQPARWSKTIAGHTRRSWSDRVHIHRNTGLKWKRNPAA